MIFKLQGQEWSNQELEESQAPKKLTKPHESILLEDSNPLNSPSQVLEDFNFNHLNSSSLRLKSQARTTTRVADFLQTPKKNTQQHESDADKREQHASNTRNVNNAL